MTIRRAAIRELKRLKIAALNGGGDSAVTHSNSKKGGGISSTALNLTYWTLSHVSCTHIYIYRNIQIRIPSPRLKILGSDFSEKTAIFDLKWGNQLILPKKKISTVYKPPFYS